jgi:hypothetical protein
VSADVAREARVALVASAEAHCATESFRVWQDKLAPQWALDAVSQRELDQRKRRGIMGSRKGSR